MIRELIENHSIYECIAFFSSDENDELTLNVGNFVIGLNEPISGWYYGFKNASFGWFPADFVKKYSSSYSKICRQKTVDALSNNDHYRTVFTDTLSQNENEFIDDFKSKYSSILTDFSTKNMSCLFEFGHIFRLCENFLLKYQKHYGNLEKELNKPIEKQKLFKIYSDLYNEIFTVILNYCHYHPFALQLLSTNKEKLEDAYNSKEITNSYVEITKFLSIPFFRMDVIANLFKEMGDCFDRTHLHYAKIQIVICQYSFCYYSCQELRYFYHFMAQVIPFLKGPDDEYIKIEKPHESLLHYSLIHPIDISIEEDSKPYYLILHSQFLFYGRLESMSDYESYCSLKCFPIRQINIADIKDFDEWSCVIEVTCNVANYTSKLVLENALQKQMFMNIFKTLKDGKKYIPFWIKTKALSLTIPNIPLQHVNIRFDTTVDTDNKPASKLDYKRLISIVSCSIAITSPSVTSNKMPSLKELSEKLAQLESTINETNRKLQNQIRKTEQMEETIHKLIKIQKPT